MNDDAATRFSREANARGCVDARLRLARALIDAGLGIVGVRAVLVPVSKAEKMARARANYLAGAAGQAKLARGREAHQARLIAHRLSTTG
jgi:hypothetical protein